MPSRSTQSVRPASPSRRTPQASVIPLRLPPAPATKAERARADALATFHRGHLDELVAHYGLPINRVVQIALRHLHRQVFPQSYPHDDTSASELAADAAAGLLPLTTPEASAVLANSDIRGTELAKRLNLKQGEMILTLADFFAKLDATASAASPRDESDMIPTDPAKPAGMRRAGRRATTRKS